MRTEHLHNQSVVVTSIFAFADVFVVAWVKLAEQRITQCTRPCCKAKTITKEGLSLHPLIAPFPVFQKKKNKQKQSLHLPTNAGEAHYYVHLLNV